MAFRTWLILSSFFEFSTAYHNHGPVTLPRRSEYHPPPQPTWKPALIGLRDEIFPSMITAIAPLVTIAANGSYQTMYSMHYHEFFTPTRVGQGEFREGVFASDPPLATCAPCGGYTSINYATNTSTISQATTTCTSQTYLGVFRSSIVSGGISTNTCLDPAYTGILNPSTTTSTGLPCCFTFPASCRPNSTTTSFTATLGVLATTPATTYAGNLTSTTRMFLNYTSTSYITVTNTTWLIVSMSSTTMSTIASTSFRSLIPSSQQNSSTTTSRLSTSRTSSLSSMQSSSTQSLRGSDLSSLQSSSILIASSMTSVQLTSVASKPQTTSIITISSTSSILYSSASSSSSTSSSPSSSGTATNTRDNGPRPGTPTAPTITIVTAIPSISNSVTTITTTIPNVVNGCGTAFGSGTVVGTGTVYIGPAGLIPVVSSGTVNGYASRVVGCGTIIASTGTFSGSATIIGCGSGSGTATMTGTGTVWPAAGLGMLSFVSSGTLTGSGRVRGCGTLVGSGVFTATEPYTKTITSTISHPRTTVEVYVSYCPTPMSALQMGLPYAMSSMTTGTSQK